jgi:hypothetical protein
MNRKAIQTIENIVSGFHDLIAFADLDYESWYSAIQYHVADLVEDGQYAKHEFNTEMLQLIQLLAKTAGAVNASAKERKRQAVTNYEATIGKSCYQPAEKDWPMIRIDEPEQEPDDESNPDQGA